MSNALLPASKAPKSIVGRVCHCQVRSVKLFFDATDRCSPVNNNKVSLLVNFVSYVS